ncbi:unnamed protein product [Candida verbasci]|uniref:Transcription initiation factor IIF subunit alpha n=1 Tax=Candida verbasci TaxID=1227364 RepID=A0A9W4TX70_9ASCO|nr:unnamed protein product [Candida verbasci]
MSSSDWQTIPLKSCSPEDINDIRFHIMKFVTRNNVDIVKDFTKPVRLHRKDPRNMQFHLTRQELDQRKKEREEEEKKGIVKEEPKSYQNYDGDQVDEDGNRIDYNKPDMSQVAPDGGARKFRKNIFKRKTRQINLMDESKRKLRYEEHYPWVIEDYDGKNVYVGNFEAASTEQQQVLFVFDKDGFKMIPAEKVYRFTPRNKYATLTLEEAEQKMEKNASVPRWLMKHMEDKSLNEGTPDQRFKANSPSVNSKNIKAPKKLRTVTGGSNDRDSDHDDLDFDEEFADDEEAPIMDGDEEENKFSEKKIKKEMLRAAHFDADSNAEEDDELDDLFEVEKSRKVDKEGKKLRKVLNKTEGNLYDSDDEEKELAPYLSKSDLESNDEDSDKEIHIKQENEEFEKVTKKVRQFTAVNLGEGFIKVKAPTSFLNDFPKLDFIGRKPNLESPRKKQKTIKIKSESPAPISTPTMRATTPPSNGGTPIPSNIDLHDSGPDGLLVTIKDVIDIVRDHPLTTKELLVGLKSRVNAHKDNKQRIINIVKQNLRLVDGKLVLRE